MNVYLFPFTPFVYRLFNDDVISSGYI